MITGDLRNKVDKIWEVFWTGGITNPLSVIEQFTYLLFMKGLDERQNALESNATLLGLEPERIFPADEPELRWSHFKQLPAEEMYSLFTDSENGTFSFIKELDAGQNSAFSTYMADAIFLIPTPAMLEKLITQIDALNMGDGDGKGDLYEYLLSKVSTSGTNGQFRTPRHIIKMMVGLTDPTPQDTIVDPAAGTAGFLVTAGEYLQRHHKELFNNADLRTHYNSAMFNGYDMDRTMLRIGAMNMMLHGVTSPNIAWRDSLSETNTERSSCTLILANPPFKGSLDYDSVAPDLLKITKTKKTELLFIALMLGTLKVGGRCATIVPDGVLFGSSKAHKELRRELVENHHLQAVISMPSGVFKPYAGVSTAVLLFEKTGIGGTDNVWFYDMQADGFSLDDKRQKIDADDIPDILTRWHDLDAETSRKRTEQSFLVPKEEIVNEGYDLSLNRYKEIEYEEVQYDAPAVIVQRIGDLEQEILQGIAELKEMVG